MSSDLKVTNIKHASSGSNNLVLASDGTTTVSGALTASGGIKVADGGTIGSASDTDAITIDSSGNVLVGTTNSNPTGANVAGASIDSSGRGNFSVDGAEALRLNRASSYGKVLNFRNNGQTTGNIGNRNETNLYIAFRTEANTDGCGLSGSSSSSGSIIPTDGNGDAVDNHIDLGTSGSRYDDINATNGTIITSDRNEKQDIEELSEAEQRVAVVAKGLLRKFRWKSAFAKKGDNARIHFGIIAQDLKSAFEAEGLDAGRYAMFIHSEWWETKETYTNDDGVEKTRTNIYDTEEEAPEGAVKKDRMGVRYTELLAFIISAI